MNKMYEVEKGKTMKSVLLDVKNTIKSELIKILSDTYGAENVVEIRTGKTTKVNEIGVVVTIVNDNGEKYPLCMTLNPVMKPYKNDKTEKKATTAFDIKASAKEYEDYVKECENKKEEMKKTKEQKIKHDKEVREKRKIKNEENKEG